MSPLIGILNYGLAGNTFNIKKAIEKVGGQVKIIENKSDFENIDKLILPGVGSFYDAMKEIDKKNLKDILIRKINELDTLGICLGMQILSTIGYESETTSGLNIVVAEVKRMSINALLPHMGFNPIKQVNQSVLFNKITDTDEFYFMHSYEVMACNNISSTSDYNGYKFISSIEKDNIYGVQFHPEKSRDAGLQLFKNFIEL